MQDLQANLPCTPSRFMENAVEVVHNSVILMTRQEQPNIRPFIFVIIYPTIS